jgi:hypothetical protein
MKDHRISQVRVERLDSPTPAGKQDNQKAGAVAPIHSGKSEG